MSTSTDTGYMRYLKNTRFGTDVVRGSPWYLRPYVRGWCEFGNVDRSKVVVFIDTNGPFGVDGTFRKYDMGEVVLLGSTSVLFESTCGIAHAWMACTDDDFWRVLKFSYVHDLGGSKFRPVAKWALLWIHGHGQTRLKRCNLNSKSSQNGSQKNSLLAQLQKFKKQLINVWFSMYPDTMCVDIPCDIQCISVSLSQWIHY